MDYNGLHSKQLRSRLVETLPQLQQSAPSIKTTGGSGAGGGQVCVCEGGGGATASCQGDTLANSGKKEESSQAQAHESFSLFYFLKHATHIGTLLLLCLNS